MTKYILSSGGMKKHPEGLKKFFAEIVKGLGQNPRILICSFAFPREKWESKFNEDKEGRFKFFPKGVFPIFSLAFPETFKEQIKNSDAIYIHGGDDHLIKYWFSKFDITEIFEEKVVAGTSSGSNVFVKHFWTCDWRENMDGLGILPIKFIPHYRSDYGDDDPRGPIDWDKAYKELEDYGDKTLQIYAIKEGEFIVVEK